MFLIVLALFAVYSGIYFVVSLLFPAVLGPVMLASFVLLLSFGVVTVGSPDEAIAKWNRRATTLQGD